MLILGLQKLYMKKKEALSAEDFDNLKNNQDLLSILEQKNISYTKVKKTLSYLSLIHI